MTDHLDLYIAKLTKYTLGGNTALLDLGCFKLAGFWVRYKISEKDCYRTHPVAPSRPHVILMVSHCADYDLRVNERIIGVKPDTDVLLVLELAVQVYSNRTRNSV